MSSTKPWRAIRREAGEIDLPPEEGRDEGLGLGELRAAVGMTQVELARRMNVDQPRVSRFERQDDVFLSTLRDYARGLGGQLELLVRFPDDRVIWLEPPSAGEALPDFVMHDRQGRVVVGQVKTGRRGSPVTNKIVNKNVNKIGIGPKANRARIDR